MLLFAWNEGADAIIMQDALLGKRIHQKYPEIVLHLSTQAGVCNVQGATFAKECGFSRVILARETPLREIEKITPIMETEVFVQGALCTCFSGQCYFSSFVGGNSGNRGRCKQPCRKQYSYDRNGYEEKAYALSLSDLCVGEDIVKLQTAGVISFKIEGRMRRSEYVASAVQYYRAILDESAENKKQVAFTALKRAYNRGNYTKGLAFAQDKRFLSRSVQGHLGEKIGVVKVENGNYLVESVYKSCKGDAFKILRDGTEIGSAFYEKDFKRGFIISSKQRLRAGDGVFLTTCVETNERVLSVERKRRVQLRLDFCVNAQACAEIEGRKVYSEWTAQQATNRPLTEEEIKACFLKTDGLPIEVAIEDIRLEGEIFLAKSQMNAFRRQVFDSLFAFDNLTEREYDYKELCPETTSSNDKTEKICVIGRDFSKAIGVDIAVYKLDDYKEEPDLAFLQGDFEKYLYLPPLATSVDLDRFSELIDKYDLDGVYVESYGGIAFAIEKNCGVFVGTGVNLTNKVAINELLKLANVKHYAISKELSETEIKALGVKDAFMLTSGDLKLMDLCYCPFEKTCGKCDKKSVYTLTDENSRQFPVRRYIVSNGECKFETYNCAKLVGNSITNGKLLDCTLENGAELAEIVRAVGSEEKQKSLYEKYTYGHSKKSVL
jgi:putative protease